MNVVGRIESTIWPSAVRACRRSTSCLLESYQDLIHHACIRHDTVPAQSYNWLMTDTYMFLVPRTAEAFQGVSANSLGYAGTFFLRSQSEIELINKHGPTKVLEQLGRLWS
jgi:sulfate adenylyltransferase (ADP) / ATP adenylyltransferase